MVIHADTRQFAFGSLSEALDIVVTWVEAMHGHGDACSALHRVLGLVDARSASVVRLQLDTAKETALERADRAGAVPAPHVPGLSFPQYLLGHGLGQAQQGTVWYASDLAREIAGDERTGSLCMPDERTREIAAIVLEPRRLSSDILVLHLPQRLSARDAGALSLLAGVLSRAWRHRSAGVFPAAVEHGRNAGAVSERSAPDAILDASNPAGLSRSEYRVCQLVSHGMSAKAISGRLLISESTVRSHLRSIYAKTRANGQRELIYKLLAAAEGAGRHAAPRPVEPHAPEGPAGRGKGAADAR